MKLPGYTLYGPLDILLCIIPVPGTGLLFPFHFLILPDIGGRAVLRRCALCVKTWVDGVVHIW